MSGPAGVGRLHTDPPPGPRVDAGRTPAVAEGLDRLSRLAAWAVGRGAPAVVLALLAWSVLLRTRNIGAPLWIDEGISVGIAHFPFAGIPHALQLDGNPPVYYLLLHVWVRLFGDAESAVHALSVLFAVATVPAAWLLARRPFGRRAAVAAAAVAATIPYLTYFGQETRMYTLVALLSLLVAGLHLRVFDVRARRWQAGLAVVLAVVLYTHTWGVFLAAGSVLAVGARALLEPAGPARRRIVKIGFFVHLAAAVVWLPWVPVLARQAADTGAPWSTTPSLAMAISALGTIAGSVLPATAFLVSLAVGGWVLAGAARGRITGWEVARPADARILRDHAIVLAVMLVSTLLFAWVASLISPAWSNRYAGVLVGPLILLAGVLLTRTGRFGVVALVVLCVAWGLSTQGQPLQHKKTPYAMVEAVAHELRPGDLVVAVQPEGLPVVAYDLRRMGGPPGLRYATAIGRQHDVRLFDWRRGLDRLQAAQSWRVADRLIAGQPAGSRVLLVEPVTTTGNWSAPWTRLVSARAKAFRALLQADPRLTPVGRRPTSGPGRGSYGVVFTVRP